MSVQSINTGKISLAQLRAAVKGRDPALPRGLAMLQLRESHFQNAHRDFEALLENENESPQIRSLAALHLGRMATPASRDILVKNIHVSEERVLLSIIQSLARIGGASELEAILQVEQYVTGRVAQQARFAAILISHRLGLDDNEYILPTDPNYVAIPDECRLAISVRPARIAEVNSGLMSLADDPFGIEYDERLMYRLLFEENIWMILLNRAFSGSDSLNKLSQTKGFLGVIAEWDAVTESHFVALLILTTPDRSSKSVHLHIHRPDGDLMYLGQGPCHDNRGSFSVQTIARTDACLPIQLEGTFGEGKLEIKTAHSALLASRKSQPGRLPSVHLGTIVG